MATTSTTTSAPVQHARESILGLTLSLEQRFGCTPKLDLRTTLNNKFGVLPTRLPTNPRLVKYFAWGNGGRANDDSNLSSAQFALGTNMSLYNMRPFRAVPEETDLSSLERSKYAMRVPADIDGTRYCLYYLKKIEWTQSEVQYIRTDPNTGVQTPYNIDYANLSPTAPARGSNGVVDDIADTVSVILPGTMTITGEEVYESVAVMDGGDPRYAVVSEFGTVSASAEMITTADFAGTPFSYEEAVFAQLMDHHCWTGQTLLSTRDFVKKNISWSLRNLING